MKEFCHCLVLLCYCWMERRSGLHCLCFLERHNFKKCWDQFYWGVIFSGWDLNRTVLPAQLPLLPELVDFLCYCTTCTSNSATKNVDQVWGQAQLSAIFSLKKPECQWLRGLLWFNQNEFYEIKIDQKMKNPHNTLCSDELWQWQEFHTTDQDPIWLMDLLIKDCPWGIEIQINLEYQ